MNIIRVRTLEDLQRCFEIRKEVFVEEQNVPIEEEIDAYDAYPFICEHVLVLKGEEAVATGRVKKHENDSAKLQRIAVIKPERGSGVGKELVMALEQVAYEQGHRVCVLDAQVSAEGFYQRLGYSTVSPEIFMDAGIPHVHMAKKLR